MQVCSKEDSKSESVIANEISTEESESERVHKSINKNKEKDLTDEAEHEEILATDNPVINDSIYFNLSECGKDILNKHDGY